MTDSSVVAEVEKVAFRAFPADVEVAHGGWRLRYTRGARNRRVNSATTPPTRPADIDADLDAVEGFYRERSADSIVRVLSTSPPEIDEIAAHRGYQSEAVTLVMTAPVVPHPTPHATVTEAPASAWLEAKRTLSGMTDHELIDWRRRLAGVTGAVGFASVATKATAVSIGLGVVDDGWLGVFDVMTHPGHRRLRHASEVTAAILDWSGGHGARAAYLQVTDVNEPALRLYDSFDFREAYRYWYRRYSPSGGSNR
jgi:GNAT superfamily N-acetyltransferase